MDNNPNRYKTLLYPSQIVYEWIQNNGDIFIMLTKDAKEHVKIQSKRNPVYGNRNGDSLLMIIGLQTLNPFKAKDLKDVLEIRFQYLRFFWYQCVEMFIFLINLMMDTSQ